jgi:hypothetical protein
MVPDKIKDRFVKMFNVVLVHCSARLARCMHACVSSSTVPRFAVAVQMVLSVRLALDHVQTGGDQQGNKLRQQLLR